MKKIIVLICFCICIYNSHAQDNKPEANSFGMQYGISYAGTLNQSLIFSGWLKKGIEVRGGLLFSFTQTDNKTSDASSIDINNNNLLPVNISTENKSGSFTITPNMSLLKHFATKSNIDPFIGGLVSVAVNMQTIQNQSINETTGDNYYGYSDQLSKTPVVTTLGLSLIGGVNYFFAKNFAIGVDAGFGFTNAITNGNRYTTAINNNYGSNNTSTNNSTTITLANNSVHTYNVNLSGNGGLRFTYYIKIKKHNKTAPKN